MTDDIRYVGVDDPLNFGDTPVSPRAPTSHGSGSRPGSMISKPLSIPECAPTKPVTRLIDVKNDLMRHPRSPTSSAALIVCPYSDEHHVSPGEFSRHIIQCRKSYLNDNPKTVQMKRCKYNGRHFVPDVEVSFHEKTCNDSFFKRIYSDMSIKPHKWVLPENKENTKELIEEQDAACRQHALKILQQTGRLLREPDSSSDSESSESDTSSYEDESKDSCIEIDF